MTLRDKSLADLERRADEALALAKIQGRNRIVASPSGFETSTASETSEPLQVPQMETPRTGP